MEGYTVFDKVKAAEVLAGRVEAEVLDGRVAAALAKTTLSKDADYALADGEKTAIIGITLTAASKTVTLGLKEGQAALVINEGGTNAFTVKNVSGDAGTSVAAGKVALVTAGTDGAAKAYVLN